VAKCGQRFSGSSPDRVGDFVIFADFEPAHHGPAAKREKMMSGAEKDDEQPKGSSQTNTGHDKQLPWRVL